MELNLQEILGKVVNKKLTLTEKKLMQMYNHKANIYMLVDILNAGVSVGGELTKSIEYTINNQTNREILEEEIMTLVNKLVKE